MELCGAEYDQAGALGSQQFEFRAGEDRRLGAAGSSPVDHLLEPSEAGARELTGRETLENRHCRNRRSLASGMTTSMPC